MAGALIRGGWRRPVAVRVPNGIDLAIAATAARQRGLITLRQLCALGLTRSAIVYRVKIGRLFRVHNGVYSVAHPPRLWLDHAAAAVLACGKGALLSHGSAAVLWGIAKPAAGIFEVSVLGRRSRPGIVIHRSSVLTGADRRRREGIWVTSPARTILDNAPRMTDVQLERAVNDLRLAHHLSPSALADVVARLPRHKAAARVKALAEMELNPTRSPLEDTFLRFVKRYRLPQPLTNVIVAGHEVDVLFPEERVIVELDGYEVHAGRASFERDRNRDADTLAAGFLTVRATDVRLKNAPREEATRLHAILARRREERAA